MLLAVLTLMPALAFASDAPADPADGAAAGAPSADEVLLLEVQVNGRSIGKIGEFTLRHGRLMARPEELRDLGFRVPASSSAQPGGLVALSELPGVIWTLDQKNQRLLITASDSSLLPATLQVNEGERQEDRRVVESGSGVTLNYDIANTLARAGTGSTASLDMRAFSPWGVLSSGWLAYAGANSSDAGKNTAIRLDSAWTFADVNSLRRYSVGDFITSTVSWFRPVHLEGVQIRSDFSTRPDLVTFPLPSVTGSTAVPSTVDVLVDRNLMISSEVASGPFETAQLPVMSGAGTITMTMTNALGQQVTVTQPFYASSALLAPDLQTFAAQAGLVRRNWGSASDQYGKMAGTANYRRGLSRKFTVEGGMEGTAGDLAGGAGGVLQVGHLGVVNFAAAASGGSAHAGAQISAGAQRIGRVFSVGASAIIASRNFRDVASMNGDPVARRQLSSFTSVSLRRFGSLGAAYAGVDRDAAPAPIQASLTPAERSHVLSGNYSLQIKRVFAYASEFRNLAGGGNSNGLQIGLTIPFGRRSSVNVAATSDGNGQVEVQKAAANIGDWGYEIYAAGGNSDHEFAEVQYKSPVGLLTAGIDSSGGETTLRVETQGALSLADGRLFPSNTIYDSFAVVDTSPVAHVQVYQENRAVGSTNSSGRLLVPDMRSFDLNHIAISATDIPADARIDNPSRELRPQDRSGVVVRFPIQFSHGALLKLVDENGVAIPVGSTATLRATGIAAPVGYDGDAYVEDLGSHNEITVELPNGGRGLVYLPGCARQHTLDRAVVLSGAQTMIRRITLVILFLLGWLAAPGARAACTITWTNLSFGTYTGTLLTGTSYGTVRCSLGQQWTIGLNAGSGAGATETVRKMTGPGGVELSYQIFQDAARTINWGDTQNVDEVTGTGTGFNQTVNVYAQVLTGQYVTPGTYTDTISSSTGSFTVTAVVQASCAISATSLAFGTYTGVARNSTSTLSIQCTNSTGYNVGLNAGTATGATVTTRRMTGSGSAVLGYSLFSDSARTHNWGNTVGTNTVAGNGTGAVQSLTVYGQIPAAQSVTPGNYSDTITATITY
jgi:outer membrane usher protein